MSNADDVLKTYDAFEGKYFDDMATQITVELLIRPGARVPVKIARQIINEDQIIAVAPKKSQQSQSASPSAYYGNGQSAPSAHAASSSTQQSTPVPTGPSRGAPREPAQNRQNGAPVNPSAPTRPRAQQQQNGAAQAAKNQNNNNNAHYNKNTSSATSGKSLLQRMNIGLAERISGAPVPMGNSTTEPASSKKNKKQGGAGAGPARPNASIANQARRNMKPYAPFPASTPTHPKAQNANTNASKNKQQPKRTETQQEILDRELENFQKKRGK
ncbi:hypothetical protein NCC49_005037 [Naganishia albida]|nr:hypothetical protein NCC49_005037 [Naganishia albida]